MTTIVQEINRIIRAVQESTYPTPFVCIEAMNGRHERAIVQMVKRHIGDYVTMETFLKAKLRRKNISKGLANQYRVLMLENMKRMVKEEA